MTDPKDFAKIFDDIKIIVPVFEVVKLPKEYEDTTKPWTPGSKRKVNPSLKEGDRIYWVKRNDEHCYKLGTNETIWFFGKPVLHQEFNYPGTDVEFLGYIEIENIYKDKK
jgi:hypothetical protein